MFDVKLAMLLRSIRKTAIVVLLLLALNRPTGELEIASILDLDRKTVRSHLRSLSQLGIVTRVDYKNGYLLTQGGLQMALTQRLGKFSPDAPVVVNDSYMHPLTKNSQLEDEDSATTTIVEMGENSPDAHMAEWDDDAVGEELSDDPGENGDKDPPPAPRSAAEEVARRKAVCEALLKAGIVINRRTRKLLDMPHITPSYISGHYERLKKNNQGNKTGLLITILETRAPLLEELIAHPKTCNCAQCRREYTRCIFCHHIPCTCGHNIIHF